jgi:hypothetical protein
MKTDENPFRKFYHDKMKINIAYIEEATTGELYELDCYIQQELHKRKGKEKEEGR